MAAGIRGYRFKQTRKINMCDQFHWGQTPLDLMRFYNDSRSAQQAVPMTRFWIDEVVDYTVWEKSTPFHDHIFESSTHDLKNFSLSRDCPSEMLQQAGMPPAIIENQIQWLDKLGLKAEADHARSKLAEFRAEARRRFYDETSGEWAPAVRPRQQIATELSVWKLDPEADWKQLAAEAVADVRFVTQNHQITGARLTYPMLHLFSQTGYMDEAVRLLTREAYPSWLNMMDATGGYMAECWRPRWHCLSQLEGFSGSGNWFYRDLVGISPDLDAPAFKHFTLAPVLPTEVGRFDFKYDSPRGEIESRMQKKGDRVQWHVVVPPNAEATLLFPGGAPDEITESGDPLAASKGIMLSVNRKSARPRR